MTADLRSIIEKLVQEQREWLAGITPAEYSAMSAIERQYVDNCRAALAAFDAAESERRTGD